MRDVVMGENDTDIVGFVVCLLSLREHERV